MPQLFPGSGSQIVTEQERMNELVGFELCEGGGYITVNGARALHLNEIDAMHLFNVLHLELGPRGADIDDMGACEGGK